jgi:hypothetical protein
VILLKLNFFVKQPVVEVPIIISKKDLLKENGMMVNMRPGGLKEAIE